MGLLRKSAAERRELVERLIVERAASGESWRSIAMRTGINYATLTGWVWRLRREGLDSTQRTARSEFIELVATEESTARNVIEVVLRGDRRLRIAADFDATTLARLVCALEAC